MALVWADGKVLRVNARAEGRFGVDDGKRQLLEGALFPGSAQHLVLRLEQKELLVQVSHDGRLWQRIARFPRGEFPGDPVAVRLGKMSPGSRNEDFSTPGPDGRCAISNLRVLGAPQGEGER
jgi:hypothetical protein